MARGQSRPARPTHPAGSPISSSERRHLAAAGRSLERKLDMVVDELLSFLQAVTSGSRIGHVILIVFVLIGLAWITAGLVNRRILNERRRTTSKATQENFEAIAAELKKRALKMKQGDDELWKREQEVTRCDKPEAFLEDTDAELRP